MGILDKPATVGRHHRQAELFRIVAELNHDEEVKRLAANVADEYEIMAMSMECATYCKLPKVRPIQETLTPAQCSSPSSQGADYIGRREAASMRTITAKGRRRGHSHSSSNLLGSVWARLAGGSESMTTTSRMAIVLIIFAYGYTPYSGMLFVN